MLNYDDEERYVYERGFDYPECVFGPDELVEILKERRVRDPEYRLDLDEKFIAEMRRKCEPSESILMKFD